MAASISNCTNHNLLMSRRPEKILALQFKYFGDAVLMTPALRALHTHLPLAHIHLLVPEEIAPLFRQLPWLTRVWSMPRRRGRANLRETWPLLRALRREHFDRSVDFASNDRGAILSRIIGSRQRLGWDEPGGFLGRRFCYNQRVAPGEKPGYESARFVHLLSGWQIPPPPSLAPEIHADPALAGKAEELLPPTRALVCHIACSMPKNEWPLPHWAAFHQLAIAAGWPVVFTTPRGAREAARATELQRLLPGARILPPINDLPLFLAVLARAGVFVSGDTGPLHFAAGLGVPTISLFGPSSPTRWAPVGPRHQALIGGHCGCDGNVTVCTTPRHCLAEIAPAQVAAALENVPARAG